MDPEQTPYVRLGGEAAVRKLVDQFYELMDTLPQAQQIRAMLADPAGWQAAIRTYRDEICFNIGRSEEYFVEHVADILAGRRQPGWRYFNWPGAVGQQS